MQSRFGDRGPARYVRVVATPPARHETRPETRHERVREIRRRIADDAYRSAEVAEEIARRILSSREL